jgi:hypothetical protein
MDVRIGEEIIISNGDVVLHIKSGYDGLFVTNISNNTAIYKKKGSRDEFLFTNAKSIQSWNEYDLLIGNIF